MSRIIRKVSGNQIPQWNPHFPKPAPSIDWKYEAKTNLNFTVNNAEFARDALVSEKVSGEAFGWNGTGYTMNDMLTTGAVRNRPIITFTNTGSSTAEIDVAVFIGSQG